MFKQYANKNDKAARSVRNSQTYVIRKISDCWDQSFTE